MPRRALLLLLLPAGLLAPPSAPLARVEAPEPVTVASLAPVEPQPPTVAELFAALRALPSTGWEASPPWVGVTIDEWTCRVDLAERLVAVTWRDADGDLAVDLDELRPGEPPGHAEAVQQLWLNGATMRGWVWLDRDGDLRLEEGESHLDLTPLVVPLGEDRGVEALLTDATVPFDLAGEGRARRWSWVTPAAGLLVWDPDGAGRVASGRDLFGSASRLGAGAWDDGYGPLATLDQDRDGQVAGPELAGVAVWQDVDVDGVADPGEVVPAVARGLVSLATRPTARLPRALVAAAGARFADGSTRATYDVLLRATEQGPPPGLLDRLDRLGAAERALRLVEGSTSAPRTPRGAGPPAGAALDEGDGDATELPWRLRWRRPATAGTIGPWPTIRAWGRWWPACGSRRSSAAAAWGRSTAGAGRTAWRSP